MRSARFSAFPLLLVLASLAACQPGTPPTQPSGVTTAPLATATPDATPTPVATPSVAGSTSPGGLPSVDPSASAGPSLAPGVLFRDDFDGSELDPERWTVYEKSGLVRVKDGVLDLLTPGASRDFPMVLANGDILPKEGPFYFELSYTSKLIGRSVGFHLDYLPPVSATEDGLTVPFMKAYWFKNDLLYGFTTETTTPQMWPVGDLRPDTPFRLRIERDGNNTWRGIVNDTEYVTFQSKRSPRRFWIGDSPNKPLPGAVNWSRMTIDYVEVGVLSEPDPATPKPGPTPAS